MGVGIDYSGGTANVDKATGIRYGVINQNEVLQAWADSSEAFYGKPHCPHCGDEIDAAEVADSMDCPHCGATIKWAGEECYPESPVSHFIMDEEYHAECGDSGDIFITKSPYFTRAAFCSPCAPGACYLMSPRDEGERAYCFGHDFFDSGAAPYPVYLVKTGELVTPKV